MIGMERLEVSASYLPQQIASSISVGILHWAESVGSFIPSRYRQIPWVSKLTWGRTSGLSLLWSYNHVSLCCFGFGNPLAFVAVWFPYSNHTFLSLWLSLLHDSGTVCLLSTPKLLQIFLPAPKRHWLSRWIAKILLLIQLYITMFLNSRNSRQLQLFNGRAVLLLGLAWTCLW